MSQRRKPRLRQGGLWRRKQPRESANSQNITLEDIGYRAHLLTSESVASLAVEIDATASSDHFQSKVAQKSSTLLIGRQEAETEVFTDMLVRKKGSLDKALLYVVSTVTMESKIQILVNNLIHRGANMDAVDEKYKTPLHFAVERNLKGVALKLLENDALPHTRDKNGTLPLKTAMDNKSDEMCAILLAYMPNFFVRNLFLSNGATKAEFSFHELLRSDMQKTIRSVLDCMIETHGSLDRIRVYYNILESDEEGRVPTDRLFQPRSKSPLQIIAKQGNKNIVYHDTVRLLTRRKWKKYARRRFEINSFLYILTLFCLTFSAIVSVGAAEPTVYNNALQVARAVMEVMSMASVALTLFTEFNQMRRHRFEYFHDTFNWFDLSSSILLATVVPLRFTHNPAQWHVFAFGYLFWTIRIFKFASVFRQTGAYAQILSRILVNDFLQFGVLFLIILLAFSGSFFLSLRGDRDLHVHNETSTFWGILFVGVRSLTEAQPVVDYTGDDGYGVVSQIFILCFLFTCIVILLNILIAQLSDTYQKVQQDAQRGLEVNRAWIVARVELNSFFLNKDFRTRFYREFEDIKDLKDVLTKWESPPLNEMNKYIRDIWDSLDNHKMNLLTVQHRMARQENALRNIQDQLRCLIAMSSDEKSKRKPAFYRSDSEPNFRSTSIEQNGGDNRDVNIDIQGIIPHDQLGELEKIDTVNAKNRTGPLEGANDDEVKIRRRTLQKDDSVNIDDVDVGLENGSYEND